jgi:signal transduction histidine kinase
MNQAMSEDGSKARGPVYICIAESQLNAVMKNLENTQVRCERQSLAMMTAGHDLRQHIHIIRAALEHLDAVATSGATNQWIATAKEQAQRLEDEALHLVESAQLCMESKSLHARPFSIEDILRRIDRDWRVFAASKGLTLEVRPCATVVVSDRRLLSVILDNVVANAVKHTALGQIIVDCIAQEDCLWIRVEDTGPGMAPEELRRFAQSASLSLSHTNGSGMGIDIVHRSAALLGHAIDVASIPGVGSYVTIKVPLAMSDMGEPAVGRNCAAAIGPP